MAAEEFLGLFVPTKEGFKGAAAPGTSEQHFQKGHERGQVDTSLDAKAQGRNHKNPSKWLIFKLLELIPQRRKVGSRWGRRVKPLASASALPSGPGQAGGQHQSQQGNGPPGGERI